MTGDADPHPEDPLHQEGQEGQGGPIVDLPGIAAFAAMGMTIAICEAGGVVVGLWIDRLWGAAPVGLIIGIVLGTVVAVLSVVKQVRRFL
ncbi:MAG TPA: AtpZ/AtpI family protein [Acidimicrobiales bacterium]|nr:AtpZ/AtpI family protein [Acidimicrobiales bacterium]